MRITKFNDGWVDETRSARYVVVMGRPARDTPGGFVYHVLNRAVGRRTIFEKDQDFLAFERIIDETLRTCWMRICAYCLLPNHWHFVLWPEQDDLSAFMQQMTNKHVKRWKEHSHETGLGHLYQGRFKSFPVQTEKVESKFVLKLPANEHDVQWLNTKTGEVDKSEQLKHAGGERSLISPRFSDDIALKVIRSRRR